MSLSNSDIIMSYSNTPNLSLTTDSFNSYYESKFLTELIAMEVPIISEDRMYEVDIDKWFAFIRNLGGSWVSYQHSSEHGVCINKDISVILSYSSKYKNTSVTIKGHPIFVAETIEKLNSTLTLVTSTIEWMYSTDGYTIKLPLSEEKIPLQEMYPFMTESLETYYQRFIDSTASILVLIGPPGTGKTSWIRGLLHHYGRNAVVTYDPAILKRDWIFAEFLESDKGIMVIEDADNFLGTREEGNDMMHKFLNVGDGLVTIPGKKLIFSTNLPSINDIDLALIRPGRCFDILSFRNLDRDEVLTLCDKLGIDAPADSKKTYTIGDVFHTQNSKAPEKKFGFV